MPAETQKDKIDFRLYIGMLFFRWQIIAVCFLYSLLGGVLYLHLAPREYQTGCSLMIYRNPALSLPGARSTGSFWQHGYLLRSGTLRGRVVKRLADEWSEKVGGQHNMMLPVNVGQGRALAPTINVSIRSGQPAYAEAFLSALLEEHKAEWHSVQMAGRNQVTEMLEGELARLEEKIRTAEEEVIEYQRLHDIARLQLRASDEAQYLAQLVGRRRGLTTEMMLLESQAPELKGLDVAVISEVEKLTRETASVGTTPKEESEEGVGEKGRTDTRRKPERTTSARVRAVKESEDPMGWPVLRGKLLQLRQKAKDLAENLKPEHPERKAVNVQIENILKQLEVDAQIRMLRLQDRYKALTIQLKAIESAEYKWQAKNLAAKTKQGELRRLESIVRRFDANYSTLYTRLHNMKVSEELNAEHWSVVHPVTTSRNPVWPDTMKILVATLVVGLGSGFGIALLAQVLDNRVQLIKDVEQELGIPFLGGVPFWVHSGLEKAIRPIVTEEHSSGAIEAYRALRTSLTTALGKINEKVVLITSADSREGKTLTTLNIAILVAQMGRRVLLIDMDLRRGRLHRSLGMEREPGVGDVLKRKLALKEVIRPTRIENLDLATTGCSVDNSAELLQSSGLTGMCVDLQDDYDYIFVDTSPVLRTTDTVIIATQGLGVVLYVARVNHTPKPLIRYSLDMLKDSRVVGLIMNSIEMHRINSLYYAYQYPNYAYYSNAYAYGYNYYNYGDTTEAGQIRRRRSWTSARHSIAQWFRHTFLPMD